MKKKIARVEFSGRSTISVGDKLYMYGAAITKIEAKNDGCGHEWYAAYVGDEIAIEADDTNTVFYELSNEMLEVEF